MAKQSPFHLTEDRRPIDPGRPGPNPGGEVRFSTKAVHTSTKDQRLKARSEKVMRDLGLSADAKVGVGNFASPDRQVVKP